MFHKEEIILYLQGTFRDIRYAGYVFGNPVPDL
jgi:hypothetical protein